MAKVSVNIILKDGVDQTTFVNDVTSNTEVDLKNQLISLPQMVVLSVEEDYINTLKSHSSISILELDEEVVPPPSSRTRVLPQAPSSSSSSDPNPPGGPEAYR